MRKIPSLHVILLALLFTAFSLPGCSWLSYSMPEASSASPASDTVVVVGRFDLQPAINPEDEQSTHWNAVGDGAIINRVFMLTSPKNDLLDTDAPSLSDFKNNIGALWSKTFFVRGTRQRTYLRAGMMVLDSVRNDRIWFPGGYYYDVPAGVSAVYIGTLRYTRGDFYKITKVEMLDEYAKAAADFRKQFGASATLTKSLLKRAK